MLYIPFLSAVAAAGGTILEKVILKKRKMEIGTYQTASFLAISLVMLPLLYFFWKLDALAFSLKNVLIFLAVIASSVFANFLVLYSMKREKITNLEPARILEPLFTILLALSFSFITEGIFERNTKILIPALVASIALVFPHIKKEHLQFNKYFIYAIIGSFFFALELVLSKFILEFYSPITFYFLRCVFVFLISWLIFKTDLRKIEKKNLAIIFGTSAIWVAYRIAVYFSYAKYGVMLTTLITMTAPIFIYILANRFLKEKLNWKNILSSAVILACVVYAMIV